MLSGRRGRPQVAVRDRPGITTVLAADQIGTTRSVSHLSREGRPAPELQPSDRTETAHPPRRLPPGPPLTYPGPTHPHLPGPCAGTRRHSMHWERFRTPLVVTALATVTV